MITWMNSCMISCMVHCMVTFTIPYVMPCMMHRMLIYVLSVVCDTLFVIMCMMKSTTVAHLWVFSAIKPYKKRCSNFGIGPDDAHIRILTYIHDYESLC